MSRNFALSPLYGAPPQGEQSFIMTKLPFLTFDHRFLLHSLSLSLLPNDSLECSIIFHIHKCNSSQSFAALFFTPSLSLLLLLLSQSLFRSPVTVVKLRNPRRKPNELQILLFCLPGGPPINCPSSLGVPANSPGSSPSGSNNH